MLTDLCEKLSAAGLDVVVICSRQLYENAAGQLPCREQFGPVRVLRVGTAKFGRGSLLGRLIDYATFFVSAGWTLARVLREGDVVVAKTDPPLISVMVALVAPARGAQSVNWLQDVFPEVAAQLGNIGIPVWLCEALARIRDRSLRRARVNVVLGERMKRVLELRAIDRSSIRVVPNWADGEKVKPIPFDAGTLRATLGGLGRFIVGYSGNLGRAHDYQTLLAAAERLRADERILFVMIGGGTGMRQLRREAGERRLTNFRFMPYQPRGGLMDALGSADLHLVSLLPQLEGLIVPSKVYGIMAAGRAIGFVGDPCGEVGALVKRFRCGFSVEVGADAELAARIAALADDRTDCIEMGQRARVAFDEHFDLDRAASKWIQVLAAAGASAGESRQSGTYPESRGSTAAEN